MTAPTAEADDAHAHPDELSVRCVLPGEVPVSAPAGVLVVLAVAAP